ncbi:hypothetical protein PAA8504_00302 [Palleronia abyssalis]|uniref:Transmembrane protein n=1 Tax=Palleronia abyssalis TaxID=1501240 RepID=A0A2R8BQY0_9RHOB|nr:hypothetical protein PAA8504_00302 [Palleronia abyssalis]
MDHHTLRLRYGGPQTHDTIRKQAKRSETKARWPLIKNGKYFVPPVDDSRDLKTLFQHLASAGAGRPVDANGFPQGPWTPDLLAEAISQIDANQSGIELRTVQLWFQENAKGISCANIRWLARIFGCDDPKATSDWQTVLSVARSRLTALRRHRQVSADSDASKSHDSKHAAASGIENSLTVHREDRQINTESHNGFRLAQTCEAIFGRRSFLDLPASVFAGAVVLGYASYFLGIHSVTYTREDGLTKQVGFLWAPNWTLLFMVFMPLFFVFAVDLLAFWKTKGRSMLLALNGNELEDSGWSRKVGASTFTFWTLLLVCLGVVGVLQWVSLRLVPLITIDSDRTTDWGSLATTRPDAISVPQAAAFTGVAYLYMCLSMYLLFVGLIFLYTLAQDFTDLISSLGSKRSASTQREIAAIVEGVFQGIFRCTVLVLMIAICMKLQSFYVKISSENIIDWLIQDTRSVFFSDKISGERYDSTTTHYSSLLVALAACVVFLKAHYALGRFSGSRKQLRKMAVVVVLLTTGYLSIGAFSGFSALLGVTVLLSIYGLFNPAFSMRQTREIEDRRNVS